jgi:hypothetical protein
VVIEYTSDLESAANLDMFDIHLMDAFEKSIKEQVKNQFKNIQENEEVDISKESYMMTYFMPNVFNIMDIPEEEIFTKTMEYKHSYVNLLAHENLDLNFILEKFKSNFISLLDAKKVIVAKTFQFIKWVISYHQVQKLHYHAAVVEDAVSDG